MRDGWHLWIMDPLWHQFTLRTIAGYRFMFGWTKRDRETRDRSSLPGSSGQMLEVSVAPEGSPAANFGFDVTPRRLVTGLITERGVCKADEKSILELFPEHAS